MRAGLISLAESADVDREIALSFTKLQLADHAEFAQRLLDPCLIGEIKLLGNAFGFAVLLGHYLDADLAIRGRRLGLLLHPHNGCQRDEKEGCDHGCRCLVRQTIRDGTAALLIGLKER
ncbi:MAG: hypothetical protein IPJ85_18185 [Flavobacteriales bacterium]|nr:hypothetical protein [Flavobacteriales bacterium]